MVLPTTPELMDLVAENGIRLVAYSPLLEGAVSMPDRPLPDAYDTAENRARKQQILATATEMGIPPSSLVMAGLIAQGVTPLIGARTLEQLEDSLAAREVTVPEHGRRSPRIDP